MATTAANTVTSLYQQYLGRSPTQADLDWWVNALNQGYDITPYIRDSDEAKTYAANKATVAPTTAPTAAPTTAPATPLPTATPSLPVGSIQPTVKPTAAPTAAPTTAPWKQPTDVLIPTTTAAPTSAPTQAPYYEPRPAVTPAPTQAPTSAPIVQTPGTSLGGTPIATNAPTPAPAQPPLASPGGLLGSTPTPPTTPQTGTGTPMPTNNGGVITNWPTAAPTAAPQNASPVVSGGSSSQPVATSDDIANYYRLYLGREARPDEVSWWANMAQTQGVNVKDAILNSAEYTAARKDIPTAVAPSVSTTPAAGQSTTTEYQNSQNATAAKTGSVAPIQTMSVNAPTTVSSTGYTPTQAADIQPLGLLNAPISPAVKSTNYTATKTSDVSPIQNISAGSAPQASSVGTTAQKVAPTTGYSATNATAQNATSTATTAQKVAPVSTYNAGTATATKATGTGYDATQMQVAPEATSAFQLNKITSADSPLNQLARKNASQAMAKRGLLNSSMAVGAAEEAVLKSAMPLALQDAQTYGRSAEVNAASDNTAKQFTAGAKNQADLTNAQLGTQVSLTNTTEANKASEFGADSKNKAGLLDAQLGTSANIETAKAANEATRQNAQLGTQVSMQNADSANKAAEFTAGAKNQAGLLDAQLGTQANVETSRATNTTNLANADAQLRAKLAEIQANTTLTATQKQLETQRAIQDAQAANDAAKANAGAQNNAFLATAENANRIALQKLQSDTTLTANERQLQYQKIMEEKRAADAAAQFAAQAMNTAGITNADNKLRADLAALQANASLTATQKQLETQRVIADANNANNLEISKGDNATKAMLASMDIASKLTMSNLDTNTKIALANLDSATKVKLSQLGNENQKLVSSNSAAANIYQQLAVAIANIQTSDKLTGNAKANAINTQIELMKAGLKDISDVTKLNLGQYMPTVEFTGGNENVPATPSNSGGGSGLLNASGNPFAAQQP